MKLGDTVERLRNQRRWTVVLLDSWLVMKSREVGTDFDRRGCDGVILTA
jgi:hypothetical protein